MNSSMIDRWVYVSNQRLLVVTFQNGWVYSYEDVPDTVIRLWKKAESKGKFFNDNIKGLYKYKREK